MSLGPSVPVYVLDDGCILSGNDFAGDSIGQVASVCVDIILRERDKFRKVVMGGWSYGGVIATVTNNNNTKLLLTTVTYNNNTCY